MLLLARGASPTMTDRNGFTPLIQAVARKKIEVGFGMAIVDLCLCMHDYLEEVVVSGGGGAKVVQSRKVMLLLLVLGGEGLTALN